MMKCTLSRKDHFIFIKLYGLQPSFLPPTYSNQSIDLFILKCNPKYNIDNKYDVNKWYMFSEYIQPICLPTSLFSPDALSGKKCYIAGWGALYYG